MKEKFTTVHTMQRLFVIVDFQMTNAARINRRRVWIRRPKGNKCKATALKENQARWHLT